MAFWKDVRELKALIALKLEQGHGTRALHEAMKQQLRDGSVQPASAEELAEAKKKPGGMAELLKKTPPAQQLRLTAKEYRRLMGEDPPDG